MQKDNKSFSTEFKHRLYKFTLQVVRCIDGLPKGMVSEVMGRQLLRSATSVLANYVEGQSASSRKDFVNFLNHSLKSANESRVWLALLRDTKRFSSIPANKLLEELEEISKILAKSIITIRKKK